MIKLRSCIASVLLVCLVGCTTNPQKPETIYITKEVPMYVEIPSEMTQLPTPPQKIDTKVASDEEIAVWMAEFGKYLVALQQKLIDLETWNTKNRERYKNAGTPTK